MSRRTAPATVLTLAALAVTALAASPALAGARQEAQVNMPKDERARKIFEEWGFADSVRHGDTVYLSGVVVGLRPGDTDLDAAYARAFDRIGKILEEAGASWDDVVDMTTYHTDVPGQLDAIVKVKHRYVKAPFPAWTAIGITRLVPDNGITEIKVVAKVKPKAP
ncbi:MAG TPA: RidA family protein [Azospirillaceae bacterium]|nr:RidA family protein [Azospirillaceae bacterium]